MTAIVVQAQDNARDRLDRIRAEIDSLGTVLEERAASEQNLLGRVNALDQQIAARRRLIGELEGQLRNERRAVQQYDTRIADTQVRLRSATRQLDNTRREVSSLEELIERRVVYLYKRGMRESLRFLLAAQNPGDLLRRRVYVNRIQQRDQSNLEALREARSRQTRQTIALDDAISDLQTAREEKAAAVARVQGLVADANAEQARLASDRRDIASMLEEVRQDQSMLQDLIAEREESAAMVEEWIASLERNRVQGNVQEVRVGGSSSVEAIVRDVPSFASFSQGEGRLPWPVRGRVVRSFGTQHNRELGTQTENPGIDIAAEVGTEVLAVQSGTCTRITYLRGFGTTLLIDHGNGYYSVYAHLGEVYVSEGEALEAGRVVGTVGTVSQSPQPTLHFQLWHQRQKLNPTRWLRS